MTIDEAIEYYIKAATQRELADEEKGDYDKWNETRFMTKKQSTQIIADNRQLAEWLTELKEAKELLKLSIDTNYSLHKSCYNCSHFTSDRNCDIGKYLYGTGEKECEWEWKHMSEIINFLHD